MEYRNLPRGGENEKISVIGLGMGYIHNSSPEELEAVVRKAIAHGINFFDICGERTWIYEPFGRAIRDCREKVFFQMHFGASYNEKGEYAWTTDVEKMKETFEWQMKQLKTDYIDYGFVHCLDTVEDFEKVVAGGLLEYLQELKAAGRVRHLAFSTHTPAVAERILDTGLMDMMMFSVNPICDYDNGRDMYCIGSFSERASLMNRCQREGVGISVMKPFHGGKLLEAASSPFGEALTHYQCMQYALDRPGVLTVLPGVRNLAELDQLLGFCEAPASEKDYSVIAGFTAEKVTGQCVYCSHCQPCPAGIDIALVNKYYDLAQTGDKIAAGHYGKLTVNANACLQCGHCDRRCPFGVAQGAKMKEIAAYFG